MLAAIAIVIEMVCGAGGGVAVAHLIKSYRFRAGVLTGASGGLILAWLAVRTPPLDRFVERVESAVDTSTHSLGGLTPAFLVGVGVAGLLGGILLTILVELGRKIGNGNR